MADEDDLASRLRQAGQYVAGSDQDDGMVDRITARLLGTGGEVQRIGRFQIERSLGHGGMGAVFQAWDPELQRRVALKLLRRDVGTHAGRRTIIEAEARALARLADRHVVQVYETGEHDGSLFVVMELVDGTTLEAWQGRPRSVRELLDKYVQAGRGLAAAHRAGLVHRDFKPANVLLRGDGEVRVADFGLARAVDDGCTQVESGSSDPSAPSDRSRAGSGTRAYMAPEQLAYGTADARTDQFSFCVALHEAIAGERPWAEGELRELALAGIASRARLSSRIPRWLAAILARGLDPNPSRRWRSMDALVEAIVRTPTRRRRILLGVGLLAALAGGWWILWRVETPSCDASILLEDVWNDERADALRVSAEGGPAFAPAAVENAIRGLDDYATRWKDAYAEACTATWVTRTQTPAQLEVATDCLDRARLGLGRAVDLIVRAEPETLARTDDVLAALGEPRTCRNREQPEPGSAREQDLLRQSDAMALLLAAGQPKEALALGEAMQLGEADRHAAAAAAWMGRGIALMELARFSEAEHALLRAAELAVTHDAGRTGLRTASALLRLYTYEVPDRERARVVETLLGGWAGRVELAPADHAAIASARAAVAELREQDLAAEVLHREAREWLASAPGGTSLSRTGSGIRLGAVLRRLGRADEASALYESLRGEIIVSLGPEHPELASAEHALGALAMSAGRLEHAERHFSRALQIQTAALGEGSVRRASALASLADLARARGDLERAIDLGEKAWTLQRTLPVGDPSRGSALQALANAHLDLGDYETSLAEHEGLLRESPARVAIVRDGIRLNIGWLLCELDRCVEARPSYEQVLLAQNYGGAWYRYAQSGLAAVELSEDRPRASLDRARRVLAELEAAGEVEAEGELVAELRWTIAQALERIGGDTREIALAAEDALAGFERAGRATAKIAAARALLTRHEK